MRAQVDQKFRHGFELTEEGLIKICDILRSRLTDSSGNPVELSIDVGRVDHALITYDSIDDVLKEDNGKVDRIKSIKIYNKMKDMDFKLNLRKMRKQDCRSHLAHATERY